MIKLESLKDLKITANFEGQRVEISKIDLHNETVSVILNAYGKKILVAYTSKDPLGAKLVLSNFTDIEVEKRN